MQIVIKEKEGFLLVSENKQYQIITPEGYPTKGFYAIKDEALLALKQAVKNKDNLDVFVRYLVLRPSRIGNFNYETEWVKYGKVKEFMSDKITDEDFAKSESKRLYEKNLAVAKKSCDLYAQAQQCIDRGKISFFTKSGVMFYKDGVYFEYEF